uniref:Uncharacterized protein n=1 Tax=Rhizophagus irregularis (strain DAOM 181602 / DAOM 197198 / MUCL 43194) TaxID=747089 RepID=U9UVR2_RHIID
MKALLYCGNLKNLLKNIRESIPKNHLINAFVGKVLPKNLDLTDIRKSILMNDQFDNCKKRFRERSKLTTHQRILYNIKPYICNFPNCTRSFSDSSAFKRHKRTHSGEKPYKCLKCGRTFTRCYYVNNFHQNKSLIISYYKKLVKYKFFLIEQDLHMKIFVRISCLTTKLIFH